MAIDAAGCNNLGHSFVTILDVQWPVLFFPETDFIHNYLHIVQKWTKNQCGKLKKFKSSVHGISNPAIMQLQGAWNYGR